MRAVKKSACVGWSSNTAPSSQGDYGRFWSLAVAEPPSNDVLAALEPVVEVADLLAMARAEATNHA